MLVYLTSYLDSEIFANIYSNSDNQNTTSMEKSQYIKKIVLTEKQELSSHLPLPKGT